MLTYKFADISDCLSSVSGNCHLDKKLDWDNQVDKDLIAIAHHMLKWEERLSADLELTDVDIHDIKEKNPKNFALQRLDLGVKG